MCKPNMLIPADDEQCNFNQVIADGAARLIIQTVGTVASLVNSNDSCGFEDTFGVLISPTNVEGAEGEMGSITWDVEACENGSEDLTIEFKAAQIVKKCGVYMTKNRIFGELSHLRF